MDRFERAKWLLGADLPSRTTLRELKKAPSADRKVRMQIYRTMPIEYITGWLDVYTRQWDAGVELSLSDYDAALTRLDGVGGDVNLLWMDWRLYRTAMSPAHAVQWVSERIRRLSEASSVPTLVNNWPENISPEESMFGAGNGERRWARELNVRLTESAEQLPGCGIIDLAYLAHSSVVPFYDTRNDRASHYPFSSQASVLIAKHLGLQLLPSLLRPGIKAIALDLDDTLYQGVLGEDGAENVRLTDGHDKLQTSLLRLKEAGILLTVCSRNEEADVRRMFDTRRDFPLRWEDFAVVMANWEPKSVNIKRIAERLNIAADDLLFIDDNPANLMEAQERWPSMGTLLAAEDGETTLVMLSNFPGIYRHKADSMGSVRTADIQARQLRESLRQSSPDETAYLRSLEMQVQIHVDKADHAHRIHELSMKTNQFNLCMKRLSEAVVERYIQDEQYLVLTVHLKDKLSDSGIVGAVICHTVRDHAELIEVVFSCRALGRDIESLMLYRLVQKLEARGVERLTAKPVQGPRNQPAMDWFAGWGGERDKSLDIGRLVDSLRAKYEFFPAEVREMQDE